MTFNIGSQTGGVVNNVVGDQYVSGTQAGIGQTAVGLTEARAAMSQLRSLLASVALPRPLTEQIQAELGEAENELSRTDPDRLLIAKKLKRVIEAGAVTQAVIGASQQIAGALRLVVQWLGPAGAHLVALLPALL